MQRKTLRIFLLVAALFAVSALVLSYDDIDLPGDAIDRGGTGPLGLVLGLDLEGGTHLVYEAQSPATIDVTFAQPVSESELRTVLVNMAFVSANITGFAKETFTIAVPDLSVQDSSGFIQLLEDELGSMTYSSVEWKDRTRINFRVKDPPNEASVTDVVRSLGYTEAEVTALAVQAFGVEGLPFDDLSAEAGTALREALEELFPLAGLEGVDDMGGVVILFEPLPEEVTIEIALANLGYPEGLVTTQDGKTFTTILRNLDDGAQDDLMQELSAAVVGVQEVTAYPIESAHVELHFEFGIDEATLENALLENGFLEAAVTGARGSDYAINLPSISDEKELTFRENLTRELGMVETFSLQRDEPTEERMVGVMDTIERRVNAFGITEPIVQRLGDNRIIVQLPGADDTNITLTFRDYVPKDNVVHALEGVGFADAKVNSIAGRALRNSIDIIIPDLTVEITQRIRASLEKDVGHLAGFRESSGIIRATFSKQLDQGILEDLQSSLDELGFEEPGIAVAVGSSFTVRLSTLTAAQADELRQYLDASIAPVESFVASGGVEEAKALIGQTARLELRERTCLSGDFRTTCSQVDEGVEAVGRRGEPLTGDNLSRAYAGTHPTTSLPIVNIVFDGTGARIFRDFTTRIAGDPTKCIAHVLDGESIICPLVDRPIVSGSGFIEGPDFTFDSVRNLSIQLESGSLPLSLEVVRESTVASLLGDQSLKASLKAGIVGLALIMLFMVVYYRMAGLVAAVALVVYAVIIVAVFKMVPVTLTLSGLAGVILSIGMAVDANILIFERLKEELRTGRSLLSAIEIGFRRAWPAIRDSNVSTFITCGILFFFGRELGEPRITGFAITLAIGVALSMFTALFVSRNLMQLLGFTPIGRKPRLFSPEGLRRQPTFVGEEKKS